MIDYIHVTYIILSIAIEATSSVLICWGLFMSLPLICIFALAFGIFGGGFSTSWTGSIKEVQQDDPAAEMGMVFGLLAFGRGIGAVTCGPISGALFNQMHALGVAEVRGFGNGYGSGYGPLIVSTGISAFCGGLSYFGRAVKLIS